MRSFFMPDQKDMVQRARNAFRAETPGTDAWVWPNNIYVSAKVLGGMVWQAFGRLKWMDRQRFALTASGYELERHGLDYGIARKASSYAQGNLLVVTDTWPYNIAAGTKFTRKSDGASFTSTQAREVGKFTLNAMVPVVSDVSGRQGNTTFGTPMDFTLTDVTSVTVDDFGLGQGADIETDDQLRTRILLRKQYPPRGGADFDYVRWALDLPGVTRVFVKGSAFGRGTVGIWFLMDDTYVAGIPQPSDVAAVQAQIDANAPVGAIPIVQAPTADCIDIIIQGITPDTQAVREAIAAEIAALFRRMAKPGMPNKPFVLDWNWIWQAVGNANGVQRFNVVAPTTDLAFGAGIMPCLQSVKFIP